MSNDNRFLKQFKEVHALWKHDGHPERPYALLTSGRISDSFFNGSKVIERPRLLEDVSSELTTQIRIHLLPGRFYPDAVVGPAEGATTLAYTMARLIPKCLAWFVEPVGEGANKKMVLKRFEKTHDNMRILVVEDTITTGSSADASVDAVLAADPTVLIYDCIGCIVNRSGQNTTPSGRKIISILKIDAQSWDRGKNPFTKDGAELVEPLRAKSNWNVLNQTY